MNFDEILNAFAFSLHRLYSLRVQPSYRSLVSSLLFNDDIQKHYYRIIYYNSLFHPV